MKKSSGIVALSVLVLMSTLVIYKVAIASEWTCMQAQFYCEVSNEKWPVWFGHFDLQGEPWWEHGVPHSWYMCSYDIEGWPYYYYDICEDPIW